MSDICNSRLNKGKKMLDRDQKKKIGVKRNGQKGLCSYQSKNEVPYGALW